MDKNLVAFIVSTNDDIINFNKDSLQRSGFDIIEYVYMPLPEDKLTHPTVLRQRFNEISQMVDGSDIIFIDPEFKYTPELGAILARAIELNLDIAFTREIEIGDNEKVPSRDYDLVMTQNLKSFDNIIESDYLMHSGKYFPLVYLIVNDFIDFDNVLKVLITEYDYKEDISLWILLAAAKYRFKSIKIETYSSIDPYLDYYADIRIDLPGLISPADSDKKPDESEIIHTEESLEHKLDPMWPLSNIDDSDLPFSNINGSSDLPVSNIDDNPDTHANTVSDESNL